MASISLDASKWNGLIGLQFAIERIMAIVRRMFLSLIFFMLFSKQCGDDLVAALALVPVAVRWSVADAEVADVPAVFTGHVFPLASSHAPNFAISG